MRKGLWLILAIAILICSFGYWVYSVHERKAAERRAIYYQTIAEAYSKSIGLRKSRKEVEAYLQSTNQKFIQRCCEGEGSRYEDMVKIGSETAPWYCSENNVYVAFQFSTKHSAEPPEPAPDDQLTHARVKNWFEGCL